MPVGCIQGSIGRPADRVSFSGRVLELVDWARGGREGGEGVDVGVEGVGVVDVEGASVDARRGGLLGTQRVRGLEGLPVETETAV